MRRGTKIWKFNKNTHDRVGINMKQKYNPKVCIECGGKRLELTDMDPDGVKYRYWKCIKCGDEVLDMKQLHNAAVEFRKLNTAKISKWGSALAIRIPKEIVRKQKLKIGYEVRILPEKNGFRVVPGKTGFKVIPEKD